MPEPGISTIFPEDYERVRPLLAKRSQLINEMYGPDAAWWMMGGTRPESMGSNRPPGIEVAETPKSGPYGPGSAVRMAVEGAAPISATNPAGYGTPAAPEPVPVQLPNAGAVPAQLPEADKAVLRKTLTGTSGADFYDPKSDIVTLGPGFTQAQAIQAENERLANRRMLGTGFVNVPTLNELEGSLRNSMTGDLTPESRLQAHAMYRNLVEEATKHQAATSEGEYRRGLIGEAKAREARLQMEQDFKMTQGSLAEIEKLVQQKAITPAEGEKRKSDLMKQDWFIQAMTRSKNQGALMPDQATKTPWSPPLAPAAAQEAAPGGIFEYSPGRQVWKAMSGQPNAAMALSKAYGMNPNSFLTHLLGSVAERAIDVPALFAGGKMLRGMNPLAGAGAAIGGGAKRLIGLLGGGKAAQAAAAAANAAGTYSALVHP